MKKTVTNAIKNKIMLKGDGLIKYCYSVDEQTADESVIVVSKGRLAWKFMTDCFITEDDQTRQYESIGKWEKKTSYSYEIILFESDKIEDYLWKVRRLIRGEILKMEKRHQRILTILKKGDQIALKGKVYICSPLSDPNPEKMKKNAEIARNLQDEISKLYRCRAIAPHGYLPFLLTDSIPEEREIAIKFDNEFLRTCDSLLVCSERISKGMREEIMLALEHNIPVYRYRGCHVDEFDTDDLQ